MSAEDLRKSGPRIERHFFQLPVFRTQGGFGSAPEELPMGDSIIIPKDGNPYLVTVIQRESGNAQSQDGR